MIRLTVHALSEPQIHLFNKPIITIGSESSQADLILPEEGLQPIYLRIIEQNNFPIVINLANDPFISLNGHPFGKKLLNNGDVILVHDTEILFETIQTPREEEKTPSPAPGFIDIELPFEKEVEALSEDEWHAASVDQFKDETALPASTPSASSKAKTRHLKDDYLKHLDDDNQKPGKNNAEPGFQSKKGMLLFMSSILLILAIIGVTMYINVLRKNEEEKIIAAREVADIAMALTRAQLLHLKPNNQNWSDAEFLNSNLSAILQSASTFEPDADPQSHFSSCPYSLRIYTNSDLSRFVLIAQPEPSLLHWLIPKSAVVVDSLTMELRSLVDLRSINRLAAYSRPLEGPNGKEISRIAAEGSLIPLSKLATNGKGHDFVPPAELAQIEPGAEKFIYNAPRYCLLCKSLIDKVINLVRTPGKSSDIASLKIDIEAFSQLPSYVIYSKEGKKEAWLAQQGLATFSPTSKKFLFGYVSIDAQGHISKKSILEPNQEILTALKPSQGSESFEEEVALTTLPAHINANNPIYLYLNSLAISREKELKPFGNTLKSLLIQQNHLPQKDFEERFIEAWNKFTALDKQHADQIRETIKSMYKQQEQMPLDEFLAYVDAAGLSHLIHSSRTGDDLNKEWTTLLNGINEINSFTAMLQHVEKTINQYGIDDLVDFNELKYYQNEFKNKLLDWIELKLLSSDQHIPDAELTSEEKESFRKLLNHEKFILPQERHYFLSELNQITASSDSRFQLRAVEDIIRSLSSPTPNYSLPAPIPEKV